MKLPALAPALVIAILLSAAAYIPSAHAQASSWGITFSGGFAKPEGGLFGSEWKRGTSVVLGMAGMVSDHMELGGEFGYVQYKPSGDSIAVPGITIGDNDWEMWRIRLRARRFLVSSEAKIAPFLIAGLGIYPISAQSTDSTGTLKVTQTGNGISLGVGADYRAGDNVAFGIEGQYHYIRTSSEVLGYKAAPMIEVLVAIRWLPGGAE
jgi:hypothetical protein